MSHWGDLRKMISSCLPLLYRPSVIVLNTVGSPPSFPAIFPDAEAVRVIEKGNTVASAGMADGIDRVLARDPLSFPLQPMDLCVVSVRRSEIPDVYEELLFDRVYPNLREDGVAVLPVPFAATDSQGAAFASRSIEPFLAAQFGHEPHDRLNQFTRMVTLDNRFAVVRTCQASAADGLDWIALQKQPSRPGAAKGPIAFARTPRVGRFSAAALSGLLERFRDGGQEFVAVDVFSDRLSNGAGNKTGFGLLKFDLHHNVRNAPIVGAAAAKLGIRALFLAMHRHPINRDFYDADETWDVLKQLAYMGHEIGLHFDPFDLVRKHGDLYSGVEQALSEMRDHGIAIRAATLHGDTSQHVRRHRLFAHDFFEEMAFRSTWDKVVPSEEPFLAQHVGKYSFTTLTQEYGLRYFAEAFFVAHGRVLVDRPLPYLSDSLRLFSIQNSAPAHGGPGEIRDEKPFRVSDRFVEAALESLEGQPFLALFHPQWYW